MSNDGQEAEDLKKWYDGVLATPEGRKDWLTRMFVPAEFALLSGEEMLAIQGTLKSQTAELALFRSSAMDQLGENTARGAHEKMKKLKQRSELGTRMQTALKMLLATGLSQQQRKMIQTALNEDLIIKP